MKLLISLALIGTALMQCVSAQTVSEITRIEFNSGTRTYREQVILTPDSVVSIEEDFRLNLKPVVKGRKENSDDWQALQKSLGNVVLSEVPKLKSPSDKRTYDAAAHGTIIITTKDNKTFTHGFDDQSPNEKLMPLMREIQRIRKEK